MKAIHIAALMALIARNMQVIMARSEASEVYDDVSRGETITAHDATSGGVSDTENTINKISTNRGTGGGSDSTTKEDVSSSNSALRSTSLLYNAKNFAKWAESLEHSSLASLGLYAPNAINMFIVLVSLLTVAPFAWFTFAGHSAPLHDYYKTFGLSFGSQAVALSLLDGIGLPDWVSIIGALAAAGVVAYRCQSGSCEHCPCMMDLWFGSILVTTVLLVVSPFVVMQSQIMFWVIVLGLAWLLQFAYPKVPLAVAQLDGIKVATISAFGFVSGVCVLASLFGFGGSFDYFAYFAVPSTFAFNQTDSLYLLLFLAATGVGSYINGVRDPKITA